MVDLPLPLTILHHPVEKLSKSSGAHALVLAPSTSIYHFPDLPDYDIEEAVLLYPTDDAVRWDEMSQEDFDKVKHVYVIDSTWTQARAIYTDPRLSKIKKITIAPQKTKFWRYQKLGEQCLSSIEAIYYTYREYLERRNGGYKKELDNLLFYFCFFYEKIQQSYTSGKFAKEGKTFTKKMPNSSYANVQKPEHRHVKPVEQKVIKADRKKGEFLPKLKRRKVEGEEEADAERGALVVTTDT